MSSQTLQLPIAGRDRELQYLADQLDLALRGTGRLVLIAGEAGIGKTRLAEEFGKVATQRGCRVLTGRCLPGLAHPYLPFQEALRGLVAKEDKGGGELGLPGWLHGPKAGKPELDSTGQSTRAWMASDSRDNPLGRVDAQSLHSTLALLKTTTAKHPIYLVLEDLHWIDSASLQLLHFLARNLTGLRLILLGTYRPEDLATREDQSHPLVETIRTMRREYVCSELAVGPLDRKGLHTAIEGMLGGRIDREALEKIWTESGGNPLFAIEVLRLLLETKSILLQNGVWKTEGIPKFDIPTTVREVILRRFEQLSQAERRVIECGATAGERFDPELIALTLHLDKLGLLELLDSLEKGSRLIRTTGDAYEFTHEKIRRTIYEQVSSLRRKELHGIIGEVLEKKLSGENLPGELSHHFTLAGNRRKSLGYSLIAGQNALSRYAVPEARDYFNRALEAAKEDSSVLKERLLALEGLGDAAALEGLAQLAVESYQDFLKLSTNARNRVRVLRKCAQNAEGAPVLEFLREAEKSLDVEPLERGRLEMIRARLAVSSGKWSEAETLASDTVRLFEQLGASEDLVGALLQQSFILMQEGRLREAHDKLDEVSKRPELSQDLVAELRLLDTKALIELASGNVSEAIDAWGKMVLRESEFRLYRRQATTHWYRGFAYLTIDDLRSARTEALRSSELVLKAGLGPPWRIFPHFLLAHLDILENRVAEAEHILDAVSPLSSSESRPNSRSQFYASPYESGYVGYMLTVQASLLSSKGEWGAANEKWLQAIKLVSKGLWSLWTESIVRVHYAKYHLLRQGLKVEAKEQFKMAIETLERLGNTTHRQIATELLASIS